MKRYKLLKDLPTFKAGQRFYLNECGDLVLDVCHHKNDKQAEYGITAYCASTLQKFPSILKDWFEEIPERPKTVDDLEEGDECWIVGCCELGYAPMQIKFGKLARVMRETGSLYLTEEDAKKDITRNKAEQILRRDTKGFKPDWKQLYEEARWVYTVCQNCVTNKLEVNGRMKYKLPIEFYFATKEDARASIKAHPDEWKMYLGVEE